MSRPCQRLLAACAALALAASAPVLAALAAGPDNTWTLLAPLPEAPDAPVFALAVSPSDNQLLLAGTQTGTIYRSRDGGKSWAPVRRDPGQAVLSIAFSPAKPGLVLAGTRGAGVLRSSDSGQTWAVQPGLERSVGRAFGFAKLQAGAGHDWHPPGSKEGLRLIEIGIFARSANADTERLTLAVNKVISSPQRGRWRI